jgi:hypothetical protein
MAWDIHTFHETQPKRPGTFTHCMNNTKTAREGVTKTQPGQPWAAYGAAILSQVLCFVVFKQSRAVLLLWLVY